MEVFERAQEARLLDAMAAHVRAEHADWAQTRPPGEVRALVEHVRSFGRAHDLRERASLCRLIDHALATGLPQEMTALQRHLLTRDGFDEARRITDWRGALAAPQLTLIDLPDAGVEWPR